MGRSEKAKGKAKSAAKRKTAPARSTRSRATGHGDLEKRLAEALEQQAATAAILRIIRSSPHDAQPVFAAVAERAMRLCGGVHGGVVMFDGRLLHLVAHVDTSAEFAAILQRTFPRPPDRGMLSARVVLTGATVNIPDLERDPDVELTGPLRAVGFRSALAVPLLRDGQTIGAILVFGAEARPFSKRQEELLQTFADQALIAIENARLFGELQARNAALVESLEQQTATGEILRVISGSPTDVRPVFEIIGESAARLCDAEVAAVTRFDGQWVHLEAIHGSSAAGVEALRQTFPMPPTGSGGAARAIRDRAIVHIPDVLGDEEYRIQATAVSAGFRALLGVPMLREGQAIGAITLGRARTGAFTDAQVQLLRTFADQAVIAIENVRLFQELDARNRALTESLEQQTATGEILRVISSSPTDVQPVFEIIAESAVRLCEAEVATVTRFDGEWVHLGAIYGSSHAGVDALRHTFPMRPSGAGGAARAVRDRDIVHIPDVLLDGDYAIQDTAVTAGFRAVLGAPMMREGRAIGAITLGRARAGAFTDAQIQLLRTFADQAVIAIENARLFQALEARNRDLAETLEQQTATSEILRVISSSPTDAQPVFEAIAAAATALCAAENAGVFLFDGELIHFAAHHRWTAEDLEAVNRTFPRPPGRGSLTARAIMTRAVAHSADISADPDYEASPLVAAGFRAVLSVPMLRDGEPIGAVNVTRREAVPFNPTQITLLETFARQAVIAIENVRLFTELGTRNRELTQALEQQTATSEILRVISSSPTDLQTVFDTIARNARALCAAASGTVFTYDGQMIRIEAIDNPDPERSAALWSAYPMPATSGHATGRAILTGRPAHIPDVREDPDYSMEALRDEVLLRSLLSVPMVRDGEPIGAITVQRWTSAQPFSDKQIALLETFADQAVIAIQNVRLFRELQVRNRDLTETLDQQTATSELLKVIGRSTFDLQPVFETLAENAIRLCAADRAQIFRFDGQVMQVVADHNISAELRAFNERNPIAPGRGSCVGRVVLERRTVHIHDVRADPDYTFGGRQIDPYRTVIGVPMLRAGELLGVINIVRYEVLPFTDSQIALMETFADQAAIAIENARLLTELQARTTQLTQSVQELQALGEVSRAVSSTLDLETVLATIVHQAVELSGSHNGIVYEFDDATESFHARATHQTSPELLAAIRAAPIRLGESAIGQAAVRREPVEVADLESEGAIVAPRAREGLVREGMRSLLAIPLFREERVLGGLVIARRDRGHFSSDIVAMLQTFATQSALAIHNARLFHETQRQKQYSEALVETSPVAIATLDLDGRVVGWNPGAERLFGYAQGEAIGRDLSELVTTPEAREEVRAAIQRVLRENRVQAIARRMRKDGTPVDVETSAMPVVVDGVQVGIIVTYHDITELLRAREEAEAANEAKGAFLATMSHEIRTPMNAVIGMSGLLLNTALTDEQREYAEVVRQSGDALLTVINDVLDFSKIEAGRLELESQPFDLRECVEGALDLVATRAAEKGLDLAYLVGDGTPAGIVGDVTRLRQILLNLLSNAVKFTERGEVVLSVSGRAAPDPPALHELTFAVRDTGIGIPPDRLDRLFQSFSQVDASTTRRYGGTGLGLAISQRLTELMGGRIEVASEVGTGSEFRFTIRAAAAEAPASSHRDLSGVQPSLRDKRVLVVDDNATNRRIVTSHLDAWGMPSRATASPAEALEWVTAGERFDVGVLDMHMPDMDGLTLARAIRERLGGQAPPLVLFTSLGRREALADGEQFAAYLHKPIKPSQLFDALVSVLAERPVHVQPRELPRADLDPDMAARHPLRILLAEDNVVNQKVALRLLGQMGYRTDVAGNGLEAVEAVARQAYDVVLMDVQMPEMDGFEASREINRRWPGERRPRIVAMTANAMQGDRELCEAAGMDDYVAKPIRIEELVAALGRSPRRGEAARGPAVREAGAVATARGPAAGGAAHGPSPIDRGTIDALAESMGGPFIAELIDTFAADAADLIVALGHAHAAADIDAFRRAAHSLKSTGETLGAVRLGALARELEAMARAGRLDGAAPRVERLGAEYEAAARALSEIRRGLSA